MTRLVLPCLLASTLAAPARAQLRRGGELQWSFDDLSVRAPQGSRHTSGWSQLYRYAAGGPLATQMIGEGEASVSFVQGRSLAQAVNGADTEQRMLGYSFAASLLPPGLRRFASLSPSFSRSKNSQSAGASAVRRDLLEEARGVTLGLSLPRLPSVSVTRSRVARWDDSDAPALDQRTDLQTEEAAYARGPFRAQYRHDATTEANRLVPAAGVRMGMTTAEAGWEASELSWGGLRSLAWRNSYRSQRNAYARALVRQEAYASDLYLSSRHFRAARGEHYLSYGGGFAHSLGAARDALRNSLTLSSSGFLKRGRLDNQLSWRRADGPARQDNVGESATAEWKGPSGRLTRRLDAGGGWTRDAAAGAALNDLLRHRLTFAPRTAGEVYAEASTNGATPLGGRPGGSRQNGVGTGAAFHAAPLADLSANYSLSRARDLGGGLVTVGNSLSLGAQISPIESMRLSLTHVLNWSRVSNGTASRAAITNLTAGYAPAQGPQVSGELSYTGRALNSALSAGYALGRTRLSLRWERVELYTVNSYSRVNVSLSRSL